MAVLEWRGDKAVTNFPAETYFGEGARSLDAEDASPESSKVPADRGKTAQPGPMKSGAAQLDSSAQELSGQPTSEAGPSDSVVAAQDSQDRSGATDASAATLAKASLLPFSSSRLTCLLAVLLQSIRAQALPHAFSQPLCAAFSRSHRHLSCLAQ